MVLQNIIFPKKDICNEKALYFHSNILLSDLDNNNEIKVKNNQTLIGDTYFNSITVSKWKKYTKIDNMSVTLCLCGKFEIRLVGAYLNKGSVIQNVFEFNQFFSEKKQDITFSVPLNTPYEIVYFHLTSLSDSSTFYGGFYSSIENNSFCHTDIKMALNLCTYKREEYICNTVERINNELIFDKSLLLSDFLDIFITDNGETLDPSIFNYSHIHFVSQPDFGASGGYTRGLIEMLKSGKPYDYVLFMDDDVVVDAESIFRTYTMLSLLKEEYKDSVLGGSFLKLSECYRQVESGGIWNCGTPIAPNKNLDVRNLKNLLNSEIINTSVNFHPWFYCCMPFSKVSEDNLPLPMFMKRDDIEYNLRFGTNYIQINGICVWHEGYEFKYNAALLYYLTRSTPIVNAIHRCTYSKEEYKTMVKNLFDNALFSYNYTLCDIILKGAEDFCGGVKRLKSIREPQNFESLLSTCYKKKPVDTIDISFSESDYKRNVMTAKQPMTKWRKFTLNGALLPTIKKLEFIPENNSNYSISYRVKSLYQYDSFQNKAVISQKSIIKTISAFFKYKKLIKKIDKKFNIAVEDFYNNYKEVACLDFWEKYLDINK